MQKKKSMILIVAYNAEKTIGELLDRIPKEIWESSEEVIIADDCSKDTTFQVANEYKKRHKKKNLTVVKHEKNKGYGGNQKWGYNYAINKGYDVVTMVHGDVQYPPEYIAPLIEPILKEETDFMFGSRMAGDPLKGGMPLYKFFANKFLSKTENMILGTNLSEFHSGFRAYSVHALKEVPFHKNTDGFHFDSEIIVQLVMAKKKIGEITIPTHYGDEKCNVPGIRYGLSILKIMGQYVLHKTNLRSFDKFEIEPLANNRP